MGFGILFLAYFLAFFVPLSYLHVIGYAGIAWALGKLKDYRPAFMRAAWWLIPLLGITLWVVLRRTLGEKALHYQISRILLKLPLLGRILSDL
jgi:hypothetical protein